MPSTKRVTAFVGLVAALLVLWMAVAIDHPPAMPSRDVGIGGSHGAVVQVTVDAQETGQSSRTEVLSAYSMNVSDTNGERLDNVQVFEKTGTTPQRTFARNGARDLGMTGPDGRIEFTPNLVDGRSRLHVCKSGFEHAIVDVWQGERSYNVVLKTAQCLHVVVKSTLGIPVPRLDVQVSRCITAYGHETGSTDDLPGVGVSAIHKCTTGVDGTTRVFLTEGDYHYALCSPDWVIVKANGSLQSNVVVPGELVIEVAPVWVVVCRAPGDELLGMQWRLTDEQRKSVVRRLPDLFMVPELDAYFRGKFGACHCLAMMAGDDEKQSFQVSAILKERGLVLLEAIPRLPTLIREPYNLTMAATVEQGRGRLRVSLALPGGSETGHGLQLLVVGMREKTPAMITVNETHVLPSDEYRVYPGSCFPQGILRRDVLKVIAGSESHLRVCVDRPLSGRRLQVLAGDRAPRWADVRIVQGDYAWSATVASLDSFVFAVPQGLVRLEITSPGFCYSDDVHVGDTGRIETITAEMGLTR